MAYKSLSIDTSNFPATAAKPFIGVDTIQPTPVTIKVNDLESYDGETVKLKLSAKSNFPYLPATIEIDGRTRGMVFFGSSAEDLLSAVKFEESGDNELKGFMSFSKNRFHNEEAFNDEASEEEIDPATLSFANLKKYAKDQGMDADEIKTHKTKEALLEALELYV